jgi:hypothetical protein
MTAVQDKPDNRSQQPPKPPLTGDRYLDNALEKLRRSLERRKKQLGNQHQPAGEPGTITKPDDSGNEIS